MNTFLPIEAQEPKSKSNYTMPLTEGTHRLRVLSSAKVGYEIWEEKDGKKVSKRYKVSDVPDDDKAKYFWVFIVYNYEQERVQIMQVTQKSIRSKIQAYVDNEAWGDPKTYDLVITRTGMKLDDTEYQVVANPHSEGVDVDISGISLDKWMEGGDPFAE